MVELADKRACTGCTACFAVCSRRAISMIPDEEGFSRPVINRLYCVDCGQCERVCPVVNHLQESGTPVCYAFKTGDRTLLMQSTSGGAFSELALPVIKRGGSVFGCVLAENVLVARHSRAQNEDELRPMRGSKYVQSDLNDCFNQCRELLIAGHEVLFSGTPCQIAGLNAYVGNKYANLTTVEVICHGAPSPAVFAAYRKEMEKAYNLSVEEIAFRHKDEAKRFSMGIKFRTPSGEPFVVHRREYFNAFINDLCLRPSCYVCSAKNGKSGADFTIADFWQVEKCELDLSYGEEGVSLIIAHSDKAKAIMRDLETSNRGNIVKEVSFRLALKGNPSYFTPVKMPHKRTLFMKGFRAKKSIVKLSNNLVFGSPLIRLLRRFKSTLQGIFA